jgi:PAS domain S-box-containing protein
MDPIVFQAGVTIPLILFLALYASIRRSDLVGRDLAVLLWLILAWLLGMVIEHLGNSDAASGRWILWLVIPPSAFMSPLFLLLMLHYARVEAFTERRAATIALMAPFGLFFVAFMTNDWHGWMMRPGTSINHAQIVEASGALFWAFQFWSTSAAVAGISICLHIAYRNRTEGDRRRMGLVAISGLVPLIVHWLDTAQWLPVDYPLTPAALTVTGVLMTVAIRQYRLLDIQPVARRDVIEASEDAVVIADREGRIVDCNPAATRLFDEKRSRLLGRSLDTLSAQIDPNQASDAMREVVQTVIAGAQAVRREFETSDGRFIEASARPVGQRGGVVSGYSVVLRDRSQERRAQHRFQHSQKLESVGILAAGVAHEVNNPLAFVRANLAHIRQASLEIAAHGHDLPAKIKEELDDLAPIVEESVDGLDRIQNIVRGLLQFSARPSGSRGPTDVNEAVTVAARFASFGGGLQWEEQLAGSLPKTIVPHDQLIQVFLNLLLNARNAVREKDQGIVRVISRADEKSIEVRIEDNGPGVPAEIREKIFDLFFTTRGPDQGTGLGLSIAHEILRENDGSLVLDEAYREGAAFVVRLPIAVDPD